MKDQEMLLKLKLMLSSLLILLGSGLIYAQEDGCVSNEATPQFQGKGDLTERESGTRKVQINSKPAALKPNSQPSESAGKMALFPTTSYCVPGDIKMQAGGMTKNEHSGKMKATGFANDVHVRIPNPDTKEFNQTMVSDSNGNLYLAWQDTYFSKQYIQIYWSQDGGATWYGYGSIMNGNADLLEPSIAVGQGKTANRILVAYIKDDGVNIPVPEVATAALGSNTFTVQSVPVWTSWEGYSKPVIITDAVSTSGWKAYLTCTGIYQQSILNYNVCTWRSLDFGDSWTNAQVPFGDKDAFTWLDPDITFGTTKDWIILVTFNGTDDTLYTKVSVDQAVTYKPEVQFYTFSASALPVGRPVDPEIAAAINTDNVMICCTRHNAGYNTPGQGYSTDGGQTWTTLWPLFSSPTFHRFGVSLCANEGGHSWHLAYTGGYHVYHAHRPQDLSSYWITPTTPVDDSFFASHDYHKKGIASNWKTDVVGIAWADYREGLPDYDTFFDHKGHHSFTADTFSVSESMGGSVNFFLEAGSKHAKRNYLIFSGISSTLPGTPLPGGYVTLPINWDIFTNLALNLLNTPIFKDFGGQLDANGNAKAKFTMLPVSGVSGIYMVFAYAVAYPWNYTSNPVQVLILP